MTSLVTKITPTSGRSRWYPAGKMRPMVLLWALGIPLPIVLIIFLIRGCG